jgi:acyl carrier protein
MTASKQAIETCVLNIWREVIGESIDRSTSLFDADIDSISAVRIVTRVRERLGARVSILDLFDCPTLPAFSAVVSRAMAETARRRSSLGAGDASGSAE